MSSGAAEASSPSGDEKPPLQWGLVVIGVAVMGLAFGGAALIGQTGNALGAGIIGMITSIAALASPRERLWRAALVIGGSTAAMLILATVTIGTPVLAGLAMFAVAFAGTMIGAAGQGFSVAGTLVSMTYLLPAATGIARDLNLVKAVELALLGLAAAFLVVAVITAIRRRHPGAAAPATAGNATASGPEANPPGVRSQVRAAMTIRDSTFRYALRRSLALGVAMGIYAATENHNVFWVMLTIFIVLQPDRASSWHKALRRSAGVMIGAIVVAGLGALLPAQVIVGIGVVVLLAGLAWYERSYTVFAAGLSFTVVAIFGASDGSFADWAALRIADTLVGAVIALLVGYRVFPDPWWRGGAKAPVSAPDSS